jgi:RNA polymerase sigma factor (sigma-70 family)
MADGRVSGILRLMGGGALSPDGGALSDGQLLERFLSDRDECAFETLVRRHGPMVLGVCRRIVGQTCDAEDAFQVTFLTLVHKAASVVPRELVGNWLYGVAYRTALNARRLAARRSAREIQVDKMPQREVVEPGPLHDLRAVLDVELSRLPEVYRLPVVLCDLGGQPRQEVARQLRVPEGTVSSRLARGRELLRKRLARGGLLPTATALVAALTGAASAAVPPALLGATLQAAALVAAGRGAGALTASVACLLHATLRQMMVARFKNTAILLLALALVGLAGLVGVAAGLSGDQAPPNPPDTPSVAAGVPAAPVRDRQAPAFVRLADPELDSTLNLRHFVNVNGTLYFVAANASDNGQLWKWDPTAKDVKTTRVTNIPPNLGRGGTAPFHLTNVNGTLFFVSRDSLRGLELWKSDGTAAGTVPIKEINPGGEINPPPMPGGMMHLGLFAAGKTLFFVCTDGQRDLGLQKSDGTAAGTVVVKDMNAVPAVDYTSRGARADVNGTLFFVAQDRYHGRELWTSDGTAAGTRLVKDIRTGPYGSDPCFLTNVNGTLFFTADDGVHGRELWKSDGTAAGTRMVKDINPGPASGFPDAWIGNLIAVGPTLFFTADDGLHGVELWKSDGTAEGTVMVKDIHHGPGSSLEKRPPGNKKPPPGTTVQRAALGPDTMAVVDNTLFFTADDGVHGYELWKSDGTAAGTVLVKDIAPGSEDGYPTRLTNVHGTLYFAACDGVHRKQLWKSDGTEAGTVPVKNFYPSDQKPIPYDEPIWTMIATNNGLFFAAHRWAPDAPPAAQTTLDLWYMPGPGRRR